MKVTMPMLSQPWPSHQPAIVWHAQLQPVQLHRSKTTRGGNGQRGVRTFLVDADVAFRSELQMEWMVRRLVREPLCGPLAVVMEFSGRSRQPVTGNTIPRPDLSNLIKAVEDAGNGFLWKDDRQIVQLAGAVRRWDRDATPLVALWAWELAAWPCGDPGAVPAARDRRPGLPSHREVVA